MRKLNRSRHMSLHAAALPLRLPAPKLATSFGAAILEGAAGGLIGLLTSSIWKAVNESTSGDAWAPSDESRGDGLRVGFTVAATLAGAIDGWRRGQVYHER